MTDTALYEYERGERERQIERERERKRERETETEGGRKRERVNWKDGKIVEYKTYWSGMMYWERLCPQISLCAISPFADISRLILY